MKNKEKTRRSRGSNEEQGEDKEIKEVIIHIYTGDRTSRGLETVGMEWNKMMGGGTDGPALRPIEIYCANPRYGMSCMPRIPYAYRPNHMTPLTTGPYSRQNPYTIPASANSSKAPLSVRGETPLPSDNAGEMSPGSSTERYPAFALIGLRENPGKNLNQVTCPDRDSNPGHLVSQPDALTVTPQVWTRAEVKIEFTWPARSPDLSPLDFFLWGSVKDSVYQNILTTPDDMQQRIRQDYSSILYYSSSPKYFPKHLILTPFDGSLATSLFGKVRGLLFDVVGGKRVEWTHEGPKPTSRLLASRSYAEVEVNDHPTRMDDPPSRYSWHSQLDFATYHSSPNASRYWFQEFHGNGNGNGNL
ncbi:hypothetical protein ANN_02684 [Periplaneta americana]|uniref:Uncharacterized protein n=1 Tax=Periplaneta americana TaxID=6978 RepID=A0ABQ8TX09_PERAM|nr:hypothetical protein ANN_02684 [Periplaneta americana]